MSKVVRPNAKEVTFKYDGLGRRIEKSFDGKTKKFLWNGDMLLHEWEETKEPPITWIFGENEITPSQKGV